MSAPRNSPAASNADFLAQVRTNPVNAELLARLSKLGLPQCHLTAGCLFQAIWNAASGNPAAWGVKDYDVFYFDDDLSWEAEDAVITRVQALCADLGVTVEVKNQARVHVWYEAKFGATYPRLDTAKAGIDRYLVTCTCVGIDIATGELYAPYGLADLYNGVLRPNPANHQLGRYLEKAQSYRARWPWLTIAP
jgi:uncharacterized protein